jgi:hypothetical protein
MGWNWSAEQFQAFGRLGMSNFYNNSDTELKEETKQIHSPCHLPYRVGSSASSAVYCTGQNLAINLYAFAYFI